ncbi:hypothetical protein GUITHDRAFT_108455 [Guillardia theta CCMP2712]|uniref:RRM domain-containing protein n=1 Tax=Guillardia theta (strain CCMP2712) TaxID=905079 RepID=L1JB76_GUITC|nr:hypothetical protein GUITHDRAFT_108455 [Guillardia theta CCMP2712]EKX45582.1 hypothetical protein GUITHDRAFT_108455 [Guillardia theta CCMP2712]|eukprot:XP_005832562.1 hypothetical protein GUITHDRAFT_108455 [Guillardia theta CCMP2712]
MRRTCRTSIFLLVFLLNHEYTSSLDSSNIDVSNQPRNMFGLSQTTYWQVQEEMGNHPCITSFHHAADYSMITVENNVVQEDKRLEALLTADNVTVTGRDARMVLRNLKGARQEGQKSTKSTLRAKARVRVLASNFLDKKKVKSVPFVDTDRLFVPNIPADITQDDIRRELSNYGEVEVVDINRNMHFARIKFNSSAPVNLILQRSPLVIKEQLLDFKPHVTSASQQEGSELQVEGRRKLITRVLEDSSPLFGVGIKRKVSQVERRLVPMDQNSTFCFQYDQNAIVVHNLHPLLKTQDVRDKFSKCGKIVDMEFGDLVEGKSKYALIRFRDHEGMSNACEMDGMKFRGRVMRIRERGKKQSMHDEFESMMDARQPSALEGTLNAFNLPGSKK